MKIYHIVNGNPYSLDTGGIRAYVRDSILKNISKSVSFFVVGSDQPTFDNLIAITKKRYSNITFFANLLIKSFRLPNTPNSIYHIHQPYMLLPFLFKTKAKYVLTLHGNQDYSVANRKTNIAFQIYHKLNRFLLGKFHGVISDNQSLLDYYEKVYKIKFSNKAVIPVGVDLSRFYQKSKYSLRKQYGYSSKEKIVLFVGRLAPEKNILLAIEAYKYLKENFLDDVRLLIVGSGPKQTEIERVISLNQSLKIELIGKTNNDLVSNYMNLSDVLVITSINEGGPIVLKEALACNLKVVSVPVGDVPLVIPQCPGSRIATYDVQSFAETIYTSLLDTQVIDYSKITSEFSKTNFQYKLLDFYKYIS